MTNPPDDPENFSEAGIRRLACSLYVHVYNEQLSEGDEQEENYLADAREIAERYPHLLSAAERWPDVDPEAWHGWDRPVTGHVGRTGVHCEHVR